MRPLRLGSDPKVVLPLVLKCKERYSKANLADRKTQQEVKGFDMKRIPSQKRGFRYGFYSNFEHSSFEVVPSTQGYQHFQAAKMSRTLVIKPGVRPVVLLTLLFHRSISRSAY